MNIREIKKIIRFDNNSYVSIIWKVKDYTLKVGNIKFNLRKEKNIFLKNVLTFKIYRYNKLVFNI